MLKLKLIFTLMMLSLVSLISYSSEGNSKDFNLIGYWSRANCFYDLPMNYFSSNGIYELRKKEKNIIPNVKMKYSINEEEKLIFIDGKESFKIISDHNLVDKIGNIYLKCDISESIETDKNLQKGLQDEKEKNAKSAVRYILSSDNITGWGEVPNGILFDLKPENFIELKELMIKEEGKYIAFFVSNILVDVVHVKSPLNGKRLFLSANQDITNSVTEALKSEVRK